MGGWVLPVTCDHEADDSHKPRGLLPGDVCASVERQVDSPGYCDILSINEHI